MVTKNNQLIIVEDSVTSRRLSVSILNYVKVVYKLQCAIKVSGCDYNYYYLDKCFRLKEKGLPLQNRHVSHFSRKIMIFISLLWPSSDHYPSQNIFGVGPPQFSGAILGLLLQGWTPERQ